MNPSREFIDAICTSASPVIDCEFCNRCHFATGLNTDLEEQELAELRAKAKAEPNKYIEDPNNDSIGWGYLNGQQVVWNCCPEKVAQYEQFIWSHRAMILGYIKERTTRELRDSQETMDAVESASPPSAGSKERGEG